MKGTSRMARKNIAAAFNTAFNTAFDPAFERTLNPAFERTLRHERRHFVSSWWGARPLNSTLGLSIVSASSLSIVSVSGVPSEPTSAIQSPSYQRRLSRTHRESEPNGLLRVSVFAKAFASRTACTPVSLWLAPEGAKPVERNVLRQAVPSKPINPLGWSASPKVRETIPARHFTAAASCAAAASPGYSVSLLAGITPRTGLAPTRQSTRTLRDEAAQRRLLLRWASPIC